jgi:endonuclease G
LPAGTTQYLCKQNYAIHYRYDTKTAEYVVEHITLQHITGSNKRKDDFRPDPSLPKQHQSTLADYAGFPYDRGHLAPGADNTHTAEAMSESFFLSNMVPQVPNHNRGIWKQLETAVRNWVLEGKDIYVVSGTIYNPGYQSIGKGQVGIPTHMWKVIVDRKNSKSIAFLFPNAPLPVAFMPQLTAQQKAVLEDTPPNLADWSSLK